MEVTPRGAPDAQGGRCAAGISASFRSVVAKRCARGDRLRRSMDYVEKDLPEAGPFLCSGAISGDGGQDFQPEFAPLFAFSIFFGVPFVFHEPGKKDIFFCWGPSFPA